MCDDELNKLYIALWTVVALVSVALVATIVAIFLNGSVLGAVTGAASTVMGGAVISLGAAEIAMGVAFGYAIAFDRCISSQNTACSGLFSSARNELAGIGALLLAALYGALAALEVSWIPVIGLAPMVTVLIALFGIVVLLIAFRATWRSYLGCVVEGFRGAGA